MGEEKKGIDQRVVRLKYGLLACHRRPKEGPVVIVAEEGT
jgi:hypothetical protein